MSVEKVDFPFMHEYMIEKYKKTLLDIGARSFAAIACDQGGHDDYKIYNATNYAVDLINKELEELKERKKKLYEDLSSKYGKKNKDWYITMDGGVHLNEGAKSDARTAEGGERR